VKEFDVAGDSTRFSAGEGVVVASLEGFEEAKREEGDVVAIFVSRILAYLIQFSGKGGFASDWERFHVDDVEMLVVVWKWIIFRDT